MEYRIWMDEMIPLPNAPTVRQRCPAGFLKIQFYAHINQKKADRAISKSEKGHRLEKTWEIWQLNKAWDLDWVLEQKKSTNGKTSDMWIKYIT